MNLYALGFAIYISAFLDVSAIIARFNVEHSRELSGQGVQLDICYLSGLGPTIIPALDEYIKRAPRETDDMEECPADNVRDWLGRYFTERPHDWRSWSFRDHRLAAYLASEPAVAMSPETTQNGASHR
jgi:hypothetical protein